MMGAVQDSNPYASDPGMLEDVVVSAAPASI
jgi:hypothetical protein